MGLVRTFFIYLKEKSYEKLFVTLLALVMLVNMSAFAADSSQKITYNSLDLSNDSVEFLNDKNIDMKIFEDVAGAPTVLYNNKAKKISYTRSYEQIIQSIKAETAAYNFTDEQVEQLINSSIHSDITFIVPDSNFARRNIDPLSENRPGDDGVGYEVESIAGFHTTTAYATLPTIYTGSESNGTDISGYMFWTVNDKIDIGLCYSSGWYGERWRFCWLYAGSTLQFPAPEDEQSYIWLQDVDQVYLRATILDNEWVLFEIINANNFNQIKSYSIYSGGLGITRANGKWRRQITLCTSDRVDDNIVVFDGGAYLLGTEFSDCYIYSGTGTSGVTTHTEGDYVNPTYCGKFGLDDTSREYVDVVDSEDWYYEKIDIEFPQ